uniref:Phospholipase A2 group III n=1 Tax=Catharus ustulatus TaxID=91951 RepID=A0A8C3V0C8_CATUS
PRGSSTLEQVWSWAMGSSCRGWTGQCSPAPDPRWWRASGASPGRLHACWARRDPRLARAFRAACAHRPPAAPGAALRRALSALWRRRTSCTDPVPPGPQRRRRRGWTLPGTLWCGAGDSAGNWNELGLFRGPDRCCREHDQCWAQITALQFNYGIRNYRLPSSSLLPPCRFRRCLLAINDTVSNIIGVTFFNLLEVPCFVLEESEECVQWHWWGGCERYGVVPLARMVQQNQYHPILPAEEPPDKGRTFSRTGHKHLRQELRAKLGRSQGRRPKTAQQPQGPGTPASARDKAEPQAGGVVLGVLLTSPHSSGPGRGCRCNKHLRKCEHQIAPNETRYQLHNVDSRILLLCNCTRRCESRRKRALCAYSWGSKQVGCLPWPAPADVCPPVPADWHGASTERGTAGTWT